VIDSDDYLCQVCLRVKNSELEPSTWRTDITGRPGAGNVCLTCLTAWEDPTPWPWCEACNSYHHPTNPTCRKKGAKA